MDLSDILRQIFMVLIFGANSYNESAHRIRAQLNRRFVIRMDKTIHMSRSNSIGEG